MRLKRVHLCDKQDEISKDRNSSPSKPTGTVTDNAENPNSFLSGSTGRIILNAWNIEVRNQ
jgi:hypothetical protein